MATRAKESKTARGPAASALTAKELAFVHALCRYPFPSIGDAAEQAGWEYFYGYDLHKKPHIQAAIQERLDDMQRDEARTIRGILQTYAKRAQMRDDMVGVAAAKLVLTAVGLGDRQSISVTTNVQNQSEQYGERVRRIFGERGVLGADDEGLTLAVKGNGKKNGNGNGHSN